MKKSVREKAIVLTVDENDRLAGTSEENAHLKALCKPLVKAFREYCVEVVYGVQTETQDEHDEIVSWYLSLTSPIMLMTLGAEETPMQHAIKNVPEKLKAYLGGNS